ncbi:hypothetical protein CU097_015812 [Rhizopus azygosporus]|uniref:Uncharacterized protein n=1 Tax=Rhizopus azygosporus TaxID=86630 RepID=A0A367KG90_RHIAZ|nr:hypothetical protein CU097_015812 [Rhizopus azygosporus]
MLANSLNQPQLVEAIDVYAEDSSDKAVTDNDENDNLLDAETSEVAQDFGSRKKRELQKYQFPSNSVHQKNKEYFLFQYYFLFT